MKFLLQIFQIDLISNDDDLMKSHQDVIVFSPDDFEQLLQLQQEFNNNVAEEEIQTNGERTEIHW